MPRDKKKVSISVDADVYEEAKSVAAELGLSFSGAIEIFLRAMIRKQGLPFDINLKSTPNP